MRAPVQINFTAPNLIPEGIAYDPFSNRFYVSSITRGTIGTVTFDGTYTPFITDEILTSTTGLKVDKAHKVLWVSNSANGVGVYDLATGSRVLYTDLSALMPGAPIFINDIALDAQGNAYATNSFSPVIYKIGRNGTASIFFQNSAFATAPGAFGFNGIQYDERGFLLVAFPGQVLKITVRDPSAYSVVQLHSLVNPDGLLLSKDGRQLVLVNNTLGTTNDKVLSFVSGDQWNSGSLSTSFSTGPVSPTTATSDGRNVYVLYSHLEKLLSGQEQNIFTIQEVPLSNPGPF